jgi:hypothetical protein
MNFLGGMIRRSNPRIIPSSFQSTAKSIDMDMEDASCLISEGSIKDSGSVLAVGRFCQSPNHDAQQKEESASSNYTPDSLALI